MQVLVLNTNIVHRKLARERIHILKAHPLRMAWPLTWSDKPPRFIRSVTAALSFLAVIALSSCREREPKDLSFGRYTSTGLAASVGVEISICRCGWLAALLRMSSMLPSKIVRLRKDIMSKMMGSRSTFSGRGNERMMCFFTGFFRLLF